MAANPRPWSAARTVWPCGSSTVDFGVTNTRAFMGNSDYRMWDRPPGLCGVLIKPYPSDFATCLSLPPLTHFGPTGAFGKSPRGRYYQAPRSDERRVGK